MKSRKEIARAIEAGWRPERFNDDKKVEAQV
jgi:hypothetical protein